MAHFTTLFNWKQVAGSHQTLSLKQRKAEYSISVLSVHEHKRKLHPVMNTSVQCVHYSALALMIRSCVTNSHMICGSNLNYSNKIAKYQVWKKIFPEVQYFTNWRRPSICYAAIGYL